jgi:acetolactate synthase I/II/III large subunit
VPDQRAIVRQYMKYEHEIRSPHNAIQIVLRALQFAMSTPQGPTYLIAARETLEQEMDLPAQPKTSQSYAKNRPLEKVGLSPNSLDELATTLIAAEKPLIVTSYCGRSQEGFESLKGLAGLLAIPVHENAPIYNNFPTTSFLHQGHQWNGGGQLPALAEADVIMVVDSDVPWIGAQSKPAESARIYHLDSDPLKDNTTLWSMPCEKRWKVDSCLALTQLAAAIGKHVDFNSQSVKDRISRRTQYLQERFQSRQSRLTQAEVTPTSGSMTVPYFMSRLRKACQSLRVVGLNESTTNLGNVADHLRHSASLSLIGSGGGALGWYSGAAVGASLALQAAGRNDDLVVAFTGDGTWLFGVPSCAYWMAKKYETPFLTIVWNNGGWASPKNACLRIHPELNTSIDGTEGLSDRVGVSITPSPSFGKIAEGAGDAWWTTVTTPEEVDKACMNAITAVTKDRRCALIEVVINTI